MSFKAVLPMRKIEVKLSLCFDSTFCPPCVGDLSSCFSVACYEALDVLRVSQSVTSRDQIHCSGFNFYFCNTAYVLRLCVLNTHCVTVPRDGNIQI